jgi:hypothetical protein
MTMKFYWVLIVPCFLLLPGCLTEQDKQEELHLDELILEERFVEEHDLSPMFLTPDAV